jgi:urease accessory protein
MDGSPGGALPCAVHPQGWAGRLSLAFARREGVTRLVRRQHEGPLLVQRAFYPEADVCHTYLLHPPGGLVGADRLSLAVTAAHDARVLLTTPSANKCYRNDGWVAEVEQRFNVASSAVVEWLPQETILFNGAHVRFVSEVMLDHGAQFCGWDINVFGRPAAAERYARGLCRSAWQFSRAGRVLFHERWGVRPDAPFISGPWAMRERPVVATLYCSGADDSLLSTLREVFWETRADECYGITRVGELLIVRWSGDCAFRAKQALTRFWAALRPSVFGREACAPRIWAT